MPRGDWSRGILSKGVTLLGVGAVESIAMARRNLHTRPSDERRRVSAELVPGFLTPTEEMFLCTCHGKRWPLSQLRMENGGQRHCPWQASPQGGSVDRDIIRDYDRRDLMRHTVDEARSNKWPIHDLDTPAVIASFSPRPLLLHSAELGILRILGVNLSSADVVVLPSQLVHMGSPSPFWSTDGTICQLTVQCISGQRGDYPLGYDGMTFDGIFQIR